MKRFLLIAVILISIVSFANADITTNLTQSASPPSQQVSGANVTFSCRYTQNGTPITNANVYVISGNSSVKANYSSSTGNYTYTTSSIPAGSYTWHCNASRLSSASEIVGDYGSQIRIPPDDFSDSSHFNSTAVTARLIEGHINFYNYLIYNSQHDWDDLPSFLEQTKDKNIYVIVDLVPESESPPSVPFGLNFTRWGKELANLSLKYPHLIGYSIDDWPIYPNLPPPHDIYGGLSSYGSGRSAAKAVNPNFKFYPTIYWDCSSGMDPSYPVDGMLLYIEQYGDSGNYPNAAYWKNSIASCKSLFPNDTIVGIFAEEDRDGSLRYNATGDVVKAKVRLAHGEKPKGVMMYSLQLNDSRDFEGRDVRIWSNVTTLYKQWNPYYQSQVGVSMNYTITKPTILNQSVTPPSGAYAPVTATFSCGYYDSSGVPITGATLLVYSASKGSYMPATYNSTASLYQYRVSNLGVGNYTWYCNASKAGYQTQIGPAQLYRVKSPGGSYGAEIQEIPTSSWSAVMALLLIIGLAGLYLSLRSLIEKSVSRGRKR